MPIRVLVVDDSAFIRRALKRVLAGDPDFEIAASAANGRLALRALADTRIDAVILDVEMPEMDGLETLRHIRADDDRLPVVMFSSLTTRGGQATIEALSIGASDYVTKPSNQDSMEEAFQSVRDELLPRLRSLVRARPARTTTATDESVPPPVASMPARPAAEPFRRSAPRATSVDLVAIGVSTGGPSALSVVLGALPDDLRVPVVITQHMPPLFTALLAERLDTTCGLNVVEAVDGDRLVPGRVYLAPGDHHLRVVRDGNDLAVALDQGPPVNSCRPAVDVMLESIAATSGARTLVAILTGMGRDGLNGSRRLAELGAPVLAQDEASSVVWGMPGYVAREDVADQVLPLDQIGPAIARIVASGTIAPLAIVPTGGDAR